MFGYRAWFYYAEQHADASMEARLDNDRYDVNELTTLTIPLDNPYQQEQTSFQRATGEISYGGVTYQLVKRKVVDGNLVLVCLSDVHKTMLKKAKSDLANASSDQNSEGKSDSRSNLQKNFNGSDYTEHDFYLNDHLIIADMRRFQTAERMLALSDAHVISLGKPPRSRA